MSQKDLSNVKDSDAQSDRKVKGTGLEKRVNAHLESKGYTLKEVGEGDILAIKGSSKILFEVKSFDGKVDEGEGSRSGRVWINREAHKRMMKKADSLGASVLYIIAKDGSSTYYALRAGAVTQYFNSHPESGNYKAPPDVLKPLPAQYSTVPPLSVGAYYPVGQRAFETDFDRFVFNIVSKHSNTPLVVTSVFDGLRVQIHRDRERVFVYDETGQDITDEFRAIGNETLNASWPDRFAMEGYLTAWSGPRGYLSGNIVPWTSRSSSKSYAFLPTDLLFVESRGVTPVTPSTSVESRLKVLEMLGPPNGGVYIKRASFGLAHGLREVPRAVMFYGNVPGSVGVQVRAAKSSGPPDIPAFVSPTKAFSNLGIDYSLPSNPGRHTIDMAPLIGRFSVTEPGYGDVDELPPYLIVRGPLFAHGKLIDASLQKAEYPWEEVRNAKLMPMPGQSLPILNFEHVDGPAFAAGVIMRIWPEESEAFDYTDVHGRRISGTGMLWHESMVLEPRAIWSILNGKLTAVSAEPYSDYDSAEEEYPRQHSIGITGAALTSHPAVLPAVLKGACGPSKCYPLRKV